MKISALVDNDGLPLSIVVAPANIHDSKLYLPTIKEFRIKTPIGRPITRPKEIIADAAYDSEEIREYNRRRGIKTNIPMNKRNRKKKRIGRPIKLDKNLYAKRSAVERFFSWIESYKKIFPSHSDQRSEGLPANSWNNTNGWKLRIWGSFNWHVL